MFCVYNLALYFALLDPLINNINIKKGEIKFIEKKFLEIIC